MLIAIAPAVAQEGADEWEPNDTREQANAIDGLYFEGMVGRDADLEDWFVLDGSEGDYPTITIWYDDAVCDIDLEVYSDSDYIGALIGMNSPDSDTFDVPGDCYLQVYAHEGSGDYAVEILPASENYDEERDEKSDECEGMDESEPNDESETADAIGSYYFQGYACADDVDWFVLNGQEDVNPTITVYYDEEKCDIDVDVYNDGELVGTLNSSKSPDSGLFDVPGECTLMVEAYSGEGWYELDIYPYGPDPDLQRQHGECEGVDEYESNDTYNSADLIKGLTIEGYACEDDDDWFYLEGQEDDAPQITLYYNDEECDIDLEVYSYDDYIGSLASAESPDSGEFEIPGICYLHVYAYTGEGKYTIEIEPWPD